MQDPELLNDLLRKARAGRRPAGLGVSIDCAAVAELAPRFGFEWILIDQEHTLIQGTRFLAEMVRAAECTGLPYFVKANSHDTVLWRDALDLGAYGVMVAFTESADQLIEMDRSIRHAPKGTRGFCTLQRNAWYSTEKYSGHSSNRESIRFANDHAIIIPTLESAEGLKNLDEMMRVESCPIWHIGLADLAISLGLDTSDLTDARRSLKVFVEVSQKMHAAGKLVTTFLMPAEGQRKELAEGMDLLGNDMPYIVDAACLGFGLAETMKVVELNRRSRAELATNKELELQL